MDFEDIFLECAGGRGRGGGDDVDVGFFACANLRAKGGESVGFQVRVECEVVKAAVGETVAVICRLGSSTGWTLRNIELRAVHVEFWTFAIRLAFARFDIDLWTPPGLRRPDNETIRGVGTTSWLRLPVSTYAALDISCQYSREEHEGRSSHAQRSRPASPHC